MDVESAAAQGYVDADGEVAADGLLHGASGGVLAALAGRKRKGHASDVTNGTCSRNDRKVTRPPRRGGQGRQPVEPSRPWCRCPRPLRSSVGRRTGAASIAPTLRLLDR